MRELALVKGCCPLDCQDTCAWVATVRDGRVTKVAGAREHPVTRGALCTKVRDYEQRTYAADRLLHPLVRTGTKGSGAFRRASWDEALDTIASRLLSVVEQHGPEAVLPFCYLGSMGIVQRRALVRIFNALGASTYHGGVCGQATGEVEDEGHPTGFDPEDMVHARFVLVWGSNPVTTCHHNWHFIAEARRRHGTRIVVIDPRVTRTARAADEHVAIRPGSDVALAAGMGRVLLSEQLVDLRRAEAVIADLDAYRRYVEPWTPERVAEVCGIDADVVARLAREFAAAEPALIRAGVGATQTREGESFVRAVSGLALLAGHWERPGGGLFMGTSPDIDDFAATRPDLRPRPARSFDMARLGETLNRTDLDPPVKALVVWGANPALSQPDAVTVRAGLAREDLFVVVLEHFMTDTARHADVILPSTTQLEHFDGQSSWGHEYISVNNPAIPPLGESKSHGEVMRLLARRLGLTDPAFEETDEQIVASVLPQGLTLEQLKHAGWHKAPSTAFRPDALTAPLLITPTTAPPPAPPAGQLQLLTPKSHHFLNSTFANSAKARAAAGGNPVVDLSPADAADRGIKDGEPVVLGNGRGELAATARVTDDVRPGVASLPGKWWHEDAPANALSPPAWSRGGQPAYNEIFVEIRPATPAVVPARREPAEDEPAPVIASSPPASELSVSAPFRLRES